MKIPKPWSIIIVIGSVAGSITATVLFWDQLGWPTNRKYTADHIDVPVAQTVVAAITKLDEKVTSQHTEWRCDEAGEELVELRIRLAPLTPVDLALTVELAFKIENLQATWDELDCKKFTQ